MNRELLLALKSLSKIFTREGLLAIRLAFFSSSRQYSQHSATSSVDYIVITLGITLASYDQLQPPPVKIKVDMSFLSMSLDNSYRNVDFCEGELIIFGSEKAYERDPKRCLVEGKQIRFLQLKLETFLRFLAPWAGFTFNFLPPS
ncbi:hypothetical protein AVEN_253175-1 [Araneus ventricosus]|uniref:Uncharacterized protein n=1 Tax=Araneus ventricosus TaxID=182803 RepID=A0A4Y2P1G1_ARAVE|nr:hypothetical protein AVEN_253175-1 [Araneus ventricosus]